MRRAVILLAAVLTGCGEQPVPSRATATPTPTPTAVAGGLWTVQPSEARTPLRCPASSSRAGAPSRVLALGDGTYVKLWGRRPRLATVDARGHLQSQKELGARGVAEQRALACGRGGRTAAAWTEYRGDGSGSVVAPYAVRVDGRTVDTASDEYDAPHLAVAFAPDGSVLVAYSVDKAVRAVLVTHGRPGKPITLGPASSISTVAAEIGSGGRAVVAWTTIDGGEERNERRRVYAVTGRGGRFGRAQRVDRAKHLNIAESTDVELRLAVAPSGRALLMWSTAATGDEDDRSTVRVAEASRSGRFRTPRQLSSDGAVGDVAIRSDGSKIVAWTDERGLHAGDELVAEGPIKEPRASFRAGRPHLEWHGGEATRG